MQLFAKTFVDTTELCIQHQGWSGVRSLKFSWYYSVNLSFLHWKWVNNVQREVKVKVYRKPVPEGKKIDQCCKPERMCDIYLFY